jgi:hypothetical protein
MATTHAPGTGIGPGGAKWHGRRAAVIAGVVLVCATIVIPFGLRGMQRSGAQASADTTRPAPTTVQKPTTHHNPAVDPAVGSHGDLPSLLPTRSDALQAGVRVRIGDVTGGLLRCTSAGGWEVAVRWDGRLQPMIMRGHVSLADGTSWVSRSGFLYTRVPTDTAGRFRVYAWEPVGGTAYTPPALVATNLGAVCFDSSFSAYGGCRAVG